MRVRLVRSRNGKWERTLQKPWGSDHTERIVNCVKIRKVRQGMLSLGLVSSFSALGGSRGLRCESCSAPNLMHWFCPYYKLILLLGLRLHLGDEQRLFSVLRKKKGFLGLLVREICCLFTQGLWERKCGGWKELVYFYGRPIPGGLTTKQRHAQMLYQ